MESWEDVADNSTSTGRGTPATTPEDEDTSLDTDGNGHHVPASKPRTKIKPKVEEATTTEKEHVNVVFIGHVGKCSFLFDDLVIWFAGENRIDLAQLSNASC